MMSILEYTDHKDNERMYDHILKSHTRNLFFSLCWFEIVENIWFAK